MEIRSNKMIQLDQKLKEFYTLLIDLRITAKKLEKYKSNLHYKEKFGAREWIHSP